MPGVDKDTLYVKDIEGKVEAWPEPLPLDPEWESALPAHHIAVGNTGITAREYERDVCVFQKCTTANTVVPKGSIHAAALCVHTTV